MADKILGLSLDLGETLEVGHVTEESDFAVSLIVKRDGEYVASLPMRLATADQVRALVPSFVSRAEQEALDGEDEELIFRVGDKVRVLRVSGAASEVTGVPYNGTVLRHDSEYLRVSRKSGEDGWWVKPSDLELIEAHDDLPAGVGR